MTRTDFTLLAKLVREYIDVLPEGFVEDLTRVLKAQYPHFDEHKFYDAIREHNRWLP